MTQSLQSPRVWEYALVALVALALRVAVIVAVPAAGVFADMTQYDGLARMVQEGRPWTDSSRGPGYPLFLALMYALPGPDLLIARLGQAGLGAACAVLTTVLATSFVSRRGALAAGIIVAVYPALVLSTIYLITEGLFTLLLVGALVAARRTEAGRTVAAGVFTALAALTRSMGIALVPAIVAGNMLQGWRERRWRRPAVASALVVLAFVLTLVPWFRHTSRVSGGLMLDSASPYNVLVGNNPRATGQLEADDFGRITQTYLVGSVNEAEQNRRAMAHSWAWIKSNPRAWLRLVPVKVGNLYGLEGREHAWVYSVGYFGERSPTTAWVWGVLLLASFPLLATAATVGLLRPGLTDQSTGTQVAALLALVALLHIISFGESRFHLPLVPVLAVLAVRGVTTASTNRLTPVRSVACVVVLLALTVGWANQAPVLLDRLLRLTAPDGWHSALPY
jgi:4-amino-4-deoxy-L-arabinose transferase-like glycosyltransferase